MTHIRESIRIDAGREKVWGLLADFGGIVRFHPGIRDSYSTSDHNSGLGATRHCDLLPAGSVEERIVGWQEGSELQVHIYDGKGTPPLDFQATRARFTVRPAGDAAVVVTMTMHYRLRYGPLGALMDRVMVRPQFQKVAENILQGLKHYAEHGEKATRADLARIRLDLAPA